ncbi:MAG: hypothetical protein AAGF95_16555 [Chloroflexota bacterium]
MTYAIPLWEKPQSLFDSAKYRRLPSESCNCGKTSRITTNAIKDPMNMRAAAWGLTGRSVPVSI